ncbi:MAG: hypothetical protein Q7R45_02960 [Sulfuricaulis sp.]|nr:hypothetical protein [Sulfuricaulis sp.]
MPAAGNDAASTNLTLLIPGLFGPSSAAEPAPATPVLETWLSRSDLKISAVHGFEPTLFQYFGAETPTEGDLPVAAVTRVLDMGVIDNGWWLRADPVHLRPERDRLILADGQVLDLTQNEANGLVAEIMEHYKADGWLLKAARPGRWYLKPPRAPKMTTSPLPDVVSRDIHPYLPQGKDGKAWHTVLNEMQILLHTAKVNEERERHGKLPINSLWFWGGGRLPKLNPVAWTQLWSEEPLSLAFARLAQVPSRAQPTDFEAWRRQADRGGEQLIVLDGLRMAQQYADESAWAAAMTQLEHQWIAPLFAAVRAGTLAQASLIADNGRQYRIARRSARRWWRRRRPLAAHA